MEKNIRVAVVQMVSTTDVKRNVETMQRLVAKAAEQGASWVVLPEYWPLMGQQDTDKLMLAEPLGQGYLQQALSEAAQDNNVILFGGTIPLQSEEKNKVMNSLMVYGRDGELCGLYHKMHLFGFSGLGERFAEEDTICAGKDIPHFQIDNISVATGVCYDLRFPEFFRAQQIFDILVLPAAFTYTTGKAHWELLLRTRAVENQCYLLASAQGGEHESGRRTFGHSMIIDPWGEIMAVLPEGEGVLVVDLDATKLQSIRLRLPALEHRIL